MKYLHLTLLGHEVDVPLAVSVDTAQHVLQQRRIVQVGNDEVETKRNARTSLFDEGIVSWQLVQRNISELGEKCLSPRLDTEMPILI